MNQQNNESSLSVQVGEGRAQTEENIVQSPMMCPRQRETHTPRIGKITKAIEAEINKLEANGILSCCGRPVSSGARRPRAGTRPETSSSAEKDRGVVGSVS